MAYRNKTYVCFDGDNDFKYYCLLRAWKAKEEIDFDFYDAHDKNVIKPESSEETIKRHLRERLQDAKLLIVLVGEHTKYLYKYVRWEIEYALENDIPIVVANLNHCETKDDQCPPILNNKLALFVPFNASCLNKAIKIWPNDHKIYRASGKLGAYCLKK